MGSFEFEALNLNLFAIGRDGLQWGRDAVDAVV